MARVNDIGIDLGTSNVLLCGRGAGILLREPAVVAVERDSRRPIAIGEDAYHMIGRTPGNVIALRPLRTGAMVDHEMTRALLQHMATKITGRRRFGARRHAVIAVPTAINDAEKRSILSAMFDVGFQRTQLIEKPIAAALGMGLPFQEAYGTMVVEMAAGCTDIAVLSMGRVAVSDCVQIGGDHFDDAIIRYIRKKHNLLIGERTAEEIKINIGCAIPRAENVSMDVTGRNLISGLPKTLAVSSSEVTESIQEPLSDLIEAVQGVLEHTPPQLASDIFEDGILLSGGAAALPGLAEALHMVLHVPCGVADDPQTCVVMGCGRALEDPAGLKYLLADGRRNRF